MRTNPYIPAIMPIAWASLSAGVAAQGDLPGRLARCATLAKLDDRFEFHDSIAWPARPRPLLPRFGWAGSTPRADSRFGAEQIDPPPCRPPARDETVTIRRGALGSYMIDVGRLAAIHVESVC